MPSASFDRNEGEVQLRRVPQSARKQGFRGVGSLVSCTSALVTGVQLEMMPAQAFVLPASRLSIANTRCNKQLVFQLCLGPHKPHK